MTTTSHEEVWASLQAYRSIYDYSQRHPDYGLKATKQQLSQPMCDYVKEYSGPQEVMQQCCEEMISSIIETHSRFCKLHGGNCYHCTSHMQLYLAARVAYHASLPNTELIVRLLDQIFQCEGSFKNLIMGAYHEPTIGLFLTRVEPLYSSLEEGLAAFRYFLHHTNLARKVFKKGGVEKRMTDLSLQRNTRLGHPAVYALSSQSTSTFQLLVEHGTNLHDVTEPTSVFSLLEMARVVAPDLDTPEVKICRQIFRREHPEVLERKEQTLMMLCRKVIRRELNRSFQLPAGIEALPLPSKIKEYLHLRCD